MGRYLKRLLITFLVAATLLVGGCTADEDAIGAIESADDAAHTITLDDGRVYVFDESTDLSTMKAGEMVQITYTVMDGKNVATAIVVK